MSEFVKNSFNMLKSKNYKILKLVYDIKDKNKDKIRIFGKKFVKFNKKKCNIIYKNKLIELKEYYNEFSDNYNTKGLIRFKLKIIHDSINMSSMFKGCTKLFSVSPEKESNNQKIMVEQNNCYSFNFKNINVISQINSNDSNIITNVKSSNRKEIITNNYYKPINMFAMFEECNEMQYVDLSFIDTSKVQDMEFMFNKCHKLKEIKGLDNFNTKNVKYMGALFQECKELEYLDLSKFNTSNVIDMGYMFNFCSKLKEIKGLNLFITNNVTDMIAIFQQCV